MWPDSAAAQTEHEVEDEMFMPLRLIAQATWTGGYALPTYAEFVAAARRIGRPLTWQGGDLRPVADGDYTIRTATGQLLGTEGTRLVLEDGGSQSWSLRATDDGYYRVTSDGRSLDVVAGQRRLGVPVEAGVPVVPTEPTESNIQKWQLVEHDDGFEVVNASTQQRLAVDTTGAVVQLPPDTTDTRWTLAPVGAPHARPPRPAAHGARRLPEPTDTGHEPGTVERWRVSVHDVSGEQQDHPATHTLDGSPQTIWHSGPAATGTPHHITYDLGADHRLASLIYTPRQGPDRDGVLKDYAIHVARRPRDWGQPAATGTLADTPASSTIDLDGAVGRYVRLVYLGSYGDGASASAAAVNVTGVPADADTLQP